MTMPLRRSFVALSVLALILVAAHTARSQGTPNTAITPGGHPSHISQTPPRDFHPIPLPDSIGDDVHAAWRLRKIVGSAYWPSWITHPPAPLVLRGNPFDFIVQHPDPPTTTTAPKEIPGGMGYYYVSLVRLPQAPATDARIEELNRWWCINYNIEGGRGGTRANIAPMLATRDFMVFETAAGKPAWADFAQMDKILALRKSVDLIAWLDTEAVSLRAAVLTDDPKLRMAKAKNAIRARGLADDIANKDMTLREALDWYETAARSEGAALYVSQIMQDEARAVAAGDTTAVLPAQGVDFANRARVWRAHLAAGKDKDVKGVNLVTVREVGAMYCVLLDALEPGWQGSFFDPNSRTTDLLGKALAGKRNSKTFSG
jgi:hypothetical protein